MRPPDSGASTGAAERSRGAMRLVPAEDGAASVHPLTTTALTLLPSRDLAGSAADIWEELDRAAAWVQDAVRAGTVVATHERGTPSSASEEQVRRALRVLCVATRAAWTGARSGSAAPIVFRSGDMPSAVPASTLARLLRQRLTAQSVAARKENQPSASPDDVLCAVLALQQVEEALREDGVQSVIDQLSGASAMEMLVEVAHDMRSPLGSILFLVERLRATDARADDRTLAIVYGAAFGLSSMVSDVMELARGGDRLATGAPEPFVVAEVVEAVRAIVAPLAEEKGLTLELEAPPRDVRVGHGPAVHRVLVNLVTNALKFTAAGEVRLTVTECSRTRLGFTIRDTGRGIPPRVLAQLFQTFRLRATGDDYAFSSAGLGLAICQRLLGAMGSALEVESTENVGTTFHFELELPPAARSRA